MNRDVKKRLENWAERDKRAGQKITQAWSEFFADSSNTGTVAADEFTGHLDYGLVAAIRAKHEKKLFAYPNVVGVSEGIKTRNEIPTGEHCLIVYVTAKISRNSLPKNGILPASIEDVPLDVVEIGRVGTLPL